MNTDYFSYGMAAQKETMDSSDESKVNVTRKSSVTAITESELSSPLAEDGGEWEGFYDNGDGWKEF
ncbi:hypothetical protein [Methylobacter sp.]|uniref:hypothetical protein n=1 Tax=Methylobacter sp. TaxID=2051955 RepID=UPI002FDCBC07